MTLDLAAVQRLTKGGRGQLPSEVEVRGEIYIVKSDLELVSNGIWMIRHEEGFNMAARHLHLNS